MKERPILFSSAMVRSILSNQKTQTRRVMKTQPKCDVSPNWPRCKTFNPSFDADGSVHCANCGHGMRLTRNGAAGIPCPYGKPGDRLWVRENFQPLLADGVKWPDADYKTGKGYAISYPATDGVQGFYDCRNDKAFCDRVTPSIHMPRWASRITLEITEVRVQRLQEISEVDAQAEGAKGGCTNCGEEPCSHDCFIHMPDYREGFANIWMGINGEQSWYANPWTWALTFKVIEETM